jgi:hypothetical protein
LPESDLRLEEFKYLTGEITARSKELSDLERYIILAVAAIYTWMLSTTTSLTAGTANDLIWWIPFALSILALARTITYQRRLAMISRYLRDTQHKSYRLKETWEGLQCETFWDNRPTKRKFSHDKKKWFSSLLFWVLAYVGGSSGVLWLLLSIFTLVVAIKHHAWVPHSSPLID